MKNIELEIADTIKMEDTQEKYTKFVNTKRSYLINEVVLLFTET